MKIFKYTIFYFLMLTFVSCVPGTQDSKSALKFDSNPSSKLSGNDKEKSIAAFKMTVYPMVTTMSCVGCHGDAKKYQPYYAVSDAAVAWQTILLDAKKINLENPESSRIYLRLKNDHHNCLTDAADKDCDSEAANMLAAIKKWKDLVKADNGSGIKTNPLYYKDVALTTPSAEFGTLLLEAEQDNFPQAMIGRFGSEADSRASGYRYASTPIAPINPTTVAARRAVFSKANACEVTTSATLTAKGSINGPFQINEDGTHINSGAITPSGLIIKDGQRPFSIAVRSLLIRPDKRMQYAKMLTGWANGTATGISQIGAMSQIALTEGNFDVGTLDVSSSGRTKGAIDVSNFPLLGTAVNDISFKTLPYFAARDSVFQPAPSTAFIDVPTSTIPNLKGSTLSLKNLFKLPQDEFTPNDILGYFNRYDAVNSSQFRRDVIFKYVKEKLDAYAASTSKYKNIVSMDSNHFYSLYGNLKLNIQACPNNICTSTTQAVEVTSGTDTDGVALTYDNALDILKVNAGGNGFDPATFAELQAGIAFTRLDLYVHHNVAADGRVYGDAFTQTFYNYANNVFTSKNVISYPLNRASSNLDLKAFYSSGANTLSRGDSLANFQTTLYPVLQQSKCISCHDGSQAMRVAHSSINPIVAFNEIERAKLVNFTTPTNSFRKAVFPAESMIVHNCGDATECAKAQSDFITAINQWNVANEASKAITNNQPFHEMTEKERTPGMLEYSFKIKKTGLYNIWTKVKTTNNFVINLRVLDGATPVNVTNKIAAPTQTTNSCIPYTFTENTDWRWFTPGRADDLTKLDSSGKLKKDATGAPLVLADNRTYWKLEEGKTYTLQIFEAAASTKIDLIAIDYVANLADILDFQPDLLARDENNIADYQKRELSYDISKLVGLPDTSAYFKVEVKTALNGQNYIFRNPRIISPNNNITVKGIKVYINGATAFNDASWNDINVTAGDGQIFTFASLLALIPNSPTTDYFQFSFDKLEKTTKTISELDPRGTAPVLVEGRKCRELDLFMNTVKPILRSARLMLKDTDGINDYLNGFPGSNRQNIGSPTTYQCMTCHNDTHPYFKMTTFDYPEILCAQALSRVDFTNYRESLLVRGIDGSGVHPKLHFIEQLQYTADGKGVMAYDENNGTNILAGMIKNQATTTTPAYFSRWITGFYFGLYTQADLGLNPVWANNSPAQQALAKLHMGQLRRIQYNLIPDLSTQTYYEPFIHDPLIGKTQSENDDLINGVFPKNIANKYETYIPNAADTDQTMSKRTMDLAVAKANGKIVKDASGKKVYNPALTADDMNTKLEDLKSMYRNVILNWIDKENQHIINGN